MRQRSKRAAIPAAVMIGRAAPLLYTAVGSCLLCLPVCSLVATEWRGKSGQTR